MKYVLLHVSVAYSIINVLNVNQVNTFYQGHAEQIVHQVILYKKIKCNVNNVFQDVVSVQMKQLVLNVHKDSY